MTDTELLNKLQKLLTGQHVRITFNWDEEDGYFCEVYKEYSLCNNTPHVADLRTATKRNTLREAMEAAVQYLLNPPEQGIFR